MNIQRITAIFEKDIRDFMKNMVLLAMPVLPFVMALFYNLIGDVQLPLTLIYVIVGAVFSVVTLGIIMIMMAEENEKKTLRGLIQSPATLLDIIIGKSLVTGLITLISLVLSLMIIGIEPFMNFRVIIGLVLLFFFFLLLGIGIGLFSKSLAATSAYMMPVIFLFGFTPLISFFGLDEDSIVLNIINRFPVMQAVEIHDNSSWLPLGIIAVWVIGAALFMYTCFKKTVKDD